jgi:hypothetical protein
MVVSLAGNVTFGTNVSMMCPTGTNFVDSYAGLYGDNGSYVTCFSRQSRPLPDCDIQVVNFKSHSSM